jgi:NAD(P)-dependent dehydrogenase (short-subunit alcohol dehydrogenase family)
LETSLQFAAEGARVLLSDVNESAVAKAAEIVRAQFPNAEVDWSVCDVSKEAQVKAMVDRAVKKWGRLDVLVSPLSDDQLVLGWS